jgi:hypothetical protein
MSTRIDKHSAPWTAIPNSILRDARLSPAAKGGLCTLLSHDAGWVRSSIAIIQRENQCGRTAAQSIMRELRDAGYAWIEKVRDDKGRLSTHYVVSSEPRTSGKPVSGEPHRRATPPTDEPSAVVEPPEVEPLDEEPQESLALRARNPQFDALGEIEGLNLAELDKGNAARIAVALSRIQRMTEQNQGLVLTPGEIFRRAENYASHFPDATLTANALAKWWPRLGAPAQPRNGKPSVAAELAQEALELERRGL